MEKNLPLAISTLEEIVNNDYVYVDKTKYAYDLFRRGGLKYVFLSRPRRFGKSLFLDTLKQMFLGNKELFKNLWIYNSDYDWQSHPIIHVDFSKFDKHNVETLEKNIIEFINTVAKIYNIEPLDEFSGMSMKFSQLIERLSKINKVVILIDEYDKPILDNIADPANAIKTRDMLKSFYDVIKGSDAYVRALFMTGITRFSQMSIFSGLNNLKDISFDDKFADILGYTQYELELFFKDHIINSQNRLKIDNEKLLVELKNWYNGYRFSDRDLRVYNPFSIINFFTNHKFNNYWFATGTPSFLIKLLKQQYPDFGDINKYSFSLDVFSMFDLEHLPIIPILYQTGYLTIKDYNPERRNYKLGYPNFEVDESFNKIIIEALANASPQQLGSFSTKIYEHLLNNNMQAFFETIQNFISAIPSELLINKEIYYNTIFHCILNLVTNQVYSQTSHFKRKSGTVVIIGNTTYIFELKLNKNAQEALDQIKIKKYYEPYINSSDTIYLVGVNFDTKNNLNIEFIEQKLA